MVTAEDDCTDDNAIENTAEDEIDELSYLLYFKTCLVDRDLEILKIKLAQTIEMREVLIKKKDTQFHKVFPFYFIEPSLVSVSIIFGQTLSPSLSFSFSHSIFLSLNYILHFTFYRFYTIMKFGKRPRIQMHYKTNGIK